MAASRQFVGNAVTDLGTDVRDAAVLMVSELATNAIVHAGSGFEVGIERTATCLRVEVTDIGAGEPKLQSPPSSEPHGRGLRIVQELADQWGMDHGASRPGKTVWYEVRLGCGPGTDPMSGGSFPPTGGRLPVSVTDEPGTQSRSDGRADPGGAR